MKHELKCWPEYFSAIDSDVKTFEIRKDDRNFRVGDSLILMEWCPKKKKYTGRVTIRYVTYITNFGQVDGNVVMAISNGSRAPLPTDWS